METIRQEIKRRKLRKLVANIYEDLRDNDKILLSADLVRLDLAVEAIRDLDK